MKAKFTILGVLLLKNGNLAVNGLSERRFPLTKRGKGATVSGEIEVEIVSVGLVNPPPLDERSQDLQIRLLKGDHSALKGAVLLFDDE
jgi:hypothetical protein